MEFGELVNYIEAFPGVSSHCCYGCQSGSFGVFDSETSQNFYSNNIYEITNDSKIQIVGENGANRITSLSVDGCLNGDNDKLFYISDSRNVYRFDSREAPTTLPTFQIHYDFEIFDLDVISTSLAVISKNGGVVTSDNRNLQRKINETQINSIAPSVLKFFDMNTLFVGYEDSTIGKFDYSSEKYTSFQIPLFLRHRKLNPLSILPFASKNNKDDNLIDGENKLICSTFLIGYESGFSVYKENGDKLIEEQSTFGQRGIFGKSVLAPCLGDDYIISIVDDSVLLPVDFENREVEKFTPKVLHGSSLTSVSANKLFVAAIEDDDDGFVTVLMPEVFLNSEIME